MKKLSGVLVATLALAFIGCAKQRPIERRTDFDGPVLNKSNFTGRVWNSKVTVVGVSERDGFAAVGFQSENRLGYFQFTKDHLQFYNAVGLYSTNETLLPELINQWGVTHSDTRLDESDGKVTNKEVEDESKNWDQKRYFQVDFSKAKVTENATFPGVYWGRKGECFEPVSASLVDGSLSVEPESVGFVVAVGYEQSAECASQRRQAHENFTYSVRYRYSFWAYKESGYQPYVYKGEDDPEMKRFGFFQTIAEQLDEKTGVLKNRILKNRWNPNRDFVDYYFTKDFPKNYKWIFTDPKTGVVARTNEVMAASGARVRFRIWDNQDGPEGLKGVTKEFGDGRYSFVHFVNEVDSSAPLGYGPSDADPLTGEIIAANTVIWTGYLQYYLKVIGDQLKREPTMIEKSTLFSQMETVLGKFDASRWTQSFDLTKGVGRAYSDVLQEVTYGFRGWTRFTNTKFASGSVAAGRSIPSGQQKATVYSSPTLSTPLFDFRSLDTLAQWMPRQAVMTARLQKSRAAIERAIHQWEKEASDSRTFHTYPLDPVLTQADRLFENTKDEEKILASLLHRVAIHEFGHNLGLRHNFYGSVDSAHFGHFDSNHDLVSGPKKSAAGVRVSTTSSVMDYMSLRHEVDVSFNWEPYDVAALKFTYSQGKEDDGKSYLFCTDEHTMVNALCNRFDSGSTPTEVALDIIKNYDDGYHRRNRRYDRAYWDTEDYQSTIMRTMISMKKFLPLWRRALDENTVRQELSKQKNLTPEEINYFVNEISREAQGAIKLSMAFYDAVIRQKDSDRPYNNEYSLFSAELQRLGIIEDKIFAMLLLMGNDTFPYHPNRPLPTMSFMSYESVPELVDVARIVFENAVTVRAEMEPWFINFARGLYGISATDAFNSSDLRKIDRIKVDRVTPDEFKDVFGIDTEGRKKFGRFSIEHSAKGLTVGDEVGYSLINGYVYFASRDENPYAFKIASGLVEADGLGERSLLQAQGDLLELYQLYLTARGDTR